MIRKIYAQLCCTEFSASLAWYAKLFARAPDEQPMHGLAEWHYGDSAGLQLFENPKDAGHGTLTLIVEDLRQEHERLESAGLTLGGLQSATSTSLVRLRDPDNNLVVLAQPGCL